jgi:hypothetical protein
MLPNHFKKSRRPENVIALSAIQINSTLRMANGELTFLLLTFQYLVGWGIFSLVISMNHGKGNALHALRLWGSACFVYIESYEFRSLAPIR